MVIYMEPLPAIHQLIDTTLCVTSIFSSWKQCILERHSVDILDVGMS